MNPQIVETLNISLSRAAAGSWARPDANQIVIEPSQCELPVPWFSISTRLAHVLQREGINRLGELNGRSYLEFWRRPNCGRKTIAELRGLLSRPGITKEFLDGECSRVPSSLHPRSPYDFDPSPPVKRLLRRLGISRLGQLNRMTAIELRFSTRATAKTVHELGEFLNRVRRSEPMLRLAEFAAEEVAGLSRELEECVRALPAPKRKMTELRLGGGNDGRVWPVHRIARELNISANEVSITLHRNWRMIRRAVGLGVRAQMERMAAWCRERVVPLTPGLLSWWLGGRGHYSTPRLRFLVRLIGKLEPGVPAWPHGTGQQRPDWRQGRILKALRPLARMEVAGLSCKEAYQRMIARTDMRDLTVVEFLGALERARIPAVRFLSPDRPQIEWRRALEQRGQPDVNTDERDTVGFL
jgi:hypothetical protein